MKWKACASRKALTIGPQSRPSGEMYQRPQLRRSRMPWLSWLEYMSRPSRRIVGWSALEMLIGAIGVTLEPSSSMTNSCRVGLV